MKTIGKILLGLLVLILLAWGAAEVWGGQILQKQIQKHFAEKGKQSINFQEIDILWFPLGLEMNGVAFELKIPQDSSILFLKGKSQKISAAGLGFWDAWRKREWNFTSVSVENSKLFFTKKDSVLKKNPVFKTPDLSILLENFEAQKTKVYFENEAQKMDFVSHFSLKNVEVSAKDSVHWKIEGAELAVANFALENSSKHSEIRLDTLFYGSEKRNLTAKNFEMTPTLSREESYQNYAYRKVQNHLKIKELEISEIDFSKIRKGLSAQKILVDSLDLMAYQDLRKKWPPKRKPLLSETLAEMPFLMDVDTVEMKNGTLKVEIKKAENEPLGLLRGDELALKIFPFSNEKYDTAAPMDLKIAGRLEEADLDMNVIFFAEKPTHDFEVNGTLGATSLAKFNPILLPISNVYFENGECNGMRLRMYGDDYACQGDLDVSYRDLKIAIPADNLDKNIFQKIGQGLANFAIIRSNNDFKDDKGAIYFDRDLGRPMVSYWWKSIETGLTGTMLRFD